MNVERAADGATILEVAVEFGGSAVDGDLRRAGQFKLAARFERDAADGFVAEADGVFAIEERVPAGAGLDAIGQGMDAVGALVGNRGERTFAVDVLLVFGADPPLGAGF